VEPIFSYRTSYKVQETYSNLSRIDTRLIPNISLLPISMLIGLPSSTIFGSWASNYPRVPYSAGPSGMPMSLGVLLGMTKPSVVDLMPMVSRLDIRLSEISPLVIYW
jgi:hypothetical protein